MEGWGGQLLLFVVSLAANFFSALAGGGAGLLQLPALLFLGLPFAIALATHKVASVFLGLGATARHLQSSEYDWRFAAFILACGVPGVITGALVILSIPDRISQLALGVLTLGLGLYS
ncbi:sulfite exporter TauE/SafE family protein, partial [Sulfurivirga sp.]|uniref:sulfite exporter TauE/SafE family protein n=1 Tax=Sulfurivirga sp. TaxID=2614236 RepID=UPI0025D0F9A4